MCHGQKSSIRGMIIQNPWSGIRKYRYNMHMICKFIQIHLHPHPTLENPYKWLYNAIYIYTYPLPLLFWHPKSWLEFSKFRKEVPPWHHGKQGCTWSHAIIHRTKVECLAAKVEEMHGPEVWHLMWDLTTLTDFLTPVVVFGNTVREKRRFFWGVDSVFVVSFRHLLRDRGKNASTKNWHVYWAILVFMVKIWKEKGKAKLCLSKVSSKNTREVVLQNPPGSSIHSDLVGWVVARAYTFNALLHQRVKPCNVPWFP